jgi:hypothetical protein
MTPDLAAWGSVVLRIHNGLSTFFYVALPVAMMLSVAIGFLRFGNENFPEVLKRALIASLLLISFPEVSNLILDVCDGLALKVDNMNGLDSFLQMAREKSESYKNASNVLLLKFDDLIMAALSFLSFLVLLVARYLIVTLYYFFWGLLSALAPLMILAYVFPSASNITKNLYKGLMEVASWKIIWAVQSAMLTSIPFANIYKTDGSYLTLIILNFVIALAMLFTPLIVKSLVGEGAHGMAQTLGTTATSAMVALPMRMANAQQFTRMIIDQTKNVGSSAAKHFKN